MTDSESEGREVVLPPETKDDSLAEQREYLRELIRLEDRRLDLLKQRTDVVARSQELNDEQDKRAAEYSREVLKSEERADIRRHGLASKVIVGGAIVAVAFFGTLMGFSFYGDSEQSALALSFLRIVMNGLGGFGIGYISMTALRRLLRGQ